MSVEPKPTEPTRPAEPTKYYWEEHVWAYEKMRREGLAGWNEVHGGSGFEHFASRASLERMLTLLPLPADPAQVRVLEYGCGTGPGACFLAARGFRVDAVDLVPDAIALARRFAAERGLDIHFEVADMCAIGPLPEGEAPPYDVVVDSFCLQSVVLDADRAKLFEAVRTRLKREGFYLITTAMYRPDNPYDEPGFLYDEESGICYGPLYDDASTYESAVQIDGAWYQPNRRHLKPAALRAELERAGFRVLQQGGKHGGELICARQDGTAALKPP